MTNLPRKQPIVQLQSFTEDISMKKKKLCTVLTSQRFGQRSLSLVNRRVCRIIRDRHTCALYDNG